MPTIIGHVDLQNFSGSLVGRMLTLELRYPGENNAAFSYPITLDNAGNYATSVVEAGTWDVSLKYTHWLRAKVTSVPVAAGCTLVDLSLMNGDATEDNVVDIFDLNEVLVHFGTASPTADLDENGLVDIFDLNITLTNFTALGAG